MAKVANPLLSFSASGKFAEQFTFIRTPEYARVQKYSRPTGPASPAQVIARENMSRASWYWKHLFSSSQNLTAWTLYAKEQGRHLSAANCFIRSALFLTPDNQAPGFIFAAVCVGRVLVLKMIDAFTGDVSAESGSFMVARGSTIEEMIYVKNLPIITGSVIGPVATTSGTFFYQVYKDSVARSGIIALTHTQGATYDQATQAGLTYDQLLAAGITWGDLI